MSIYTFVAVLFIFNSLLHVAYGTAIYHNPHNLSNWDPTLPDTWIKNNTSCQNIVSTKNCYSLYFYRNLICICVGLLKIGHVVVSCKTVYQWVMTNCCFMSNILPYHGIWYKQLNKLNWHYTRMTPLSSRNHGVLTPSLDDSLLLWTPYTDLSQNGNSTWTLTKPRLYCSPNIVLPLHPYPNFNTLLFLGVPIFNT